MLKFTLWPEDVYETRSDVIDYVDVLTTWLEYSTAWRLGVQDDSYMDKTLCTKCAVPVGDGHLFFEQFDVNGLLAAVLCFECAEEQYRATSRNPVARPDIPEILIDKGGYSCSCMASDLHGVDSTVWKRRLA